MIRVYFHREDEPIGFVQYDGRSMTTHPKPGSEKFFGKLLGQKILVPGGDDLHPIGPEHGVEWINALQHKFRTGYLNASPPQNC